MSKSVDNKNVSTTTPNTIDKSLITSEDVKEVVSGNQQALIEQLERAKQVAKEQLLNAQKNAPNHQLPKQTEELLQAELAKREAELQLAMTQVNMKKVNDSIANPGTVANIGGVPQGGKVKKVMEVKIDPNTQVNQVKQGSTPQPAPIQTQNSAPLNQPSIKKAKRKKEKKPSNFKYVMTIILFVGLFAFVYFLPEISHYIAERQYLKNSNDEEINTGTLSCKKSSNDDNYDYNYSFEFTFADSKLLTLTTTSKTSGSLDEDKEHLEELKDNCDRLKKEVKKLDGITVTCSLSGYTNTNEQVIRYAEIDKKKLTSSYIEAGGTYPNYKYKQNIDKIEKEMKASGYSCKRIK